MTCYRLNNPPVISETVDDEVIVINLDDGHYHALNGDAAVVWDALLAGFSTEQILASAKDDPSKARTRYEAFVAKLLDKSLILPADPQTRAGQVQGWSTDGLRFESFDDMSDLLGLDPVHEVDVERGWPQHPDQASG